MKNTNSLYQVVFLMSLLLLSNRLMAKEKEILKTDVLTPKIAIILNSGSASVTRIDMQKKEVIDEFSIGKEPHHFHKQRIQVRSLRDLPSAQ